MGVAPRLQHAGESLQRVACHPPLDPAVRVRPSLGGSSHAALAQCSFEACRHTTCAPRRLQRAGGSTALADPIPAPASRFRGGAPMFPFPLTLAFALIGPAAAPIA